MTSSIIMIIIIADINHHPSLFIGYL